MIDEQLNDVREICAMHATPYSYSVVPMIINTSVASVHTSEMKVALMEFNVKLLYFVW
jgi:hypothetical protein